MRSPGRGPGEGAGRLGSVGTAAQGAAPAGHASLARTPAPSAPRRPQCPLPEAGQMGSCPGTRHCPAQLPGPGAQRPCSLTAPASSGPGGQGLTVGGRDGQKPHAGPPSTRSQACSRVYVRASAPGADSDPYPDPHHSCPGRQQRGVQTGRLGRGGPRASRGRALAWGHSPGSSEGVWQGASSPAPGASVSPAL